MPLNPMTGQFEYGGASYDMPTMGAGMAAGGMEALGADVPLAFQMLENMPGITAMALYNSRRFANTMQKGGYRDILDPDAEVSSHKKRRARRAGAFMPDDAGNIVQSATDQRFFFGKSRGATAAGKTPFLKQSFGNNAPRPRNIGRFATAGDLSGVANAGQYTFAQGLSGFVSPMFEKTKAGQAARASAQAAGFSDDAALMSGGVLGRITTMGRIGAGYEFAAKAEKLGARSGFAKKITASGYRSRRLEARSAKILTGIDRTLDALGQTAAAGQTLTKRTALTAGGFLTSKFLEDVATLVDEDFISKGFKVKNYKPFDPTNMTASQTRFKTMFEAVLGGPGADDAMLQLGKKKTAQVAATAFGNKQYGLAAKLGGRALGAYLRPVMQPLNVIGTASVVYDLSKMAATGIVSAGNFAKEAVKSMQGSMRKPLFGMGYQDNEVAATSRSRGVMAIQNSRLNARSMLGSEASMMAAHFG